MEREDVQSFPELQSAEAAVAGSLPAAAGASSHLPTGAMIGRRRRGFWPIAVALIGCCGSLAVIAGFVIVRMINATTAMVLPETLGSPSDPHRQLHSVSLMPGVESELAFSIVESLEDEGLDATVAQLQKLPVETPSDWWVAGRMLRYVATKLQDRGDLVPGKRARFLQDLAEKLAPTHLSKDQRDTLVRWVAMPQPWYVLTPLSGAPNFGLFEKVLPPQVQLDLFMPVSDGQQICAWRPAPAEAGDVLDIRARALHEGPAVAFAATWVANLAQRDVYLQLGSTDAAQVWINQEPVLRSKEYRPLDYPQDRVRVELPSGTSMVLVRLDRGNDPWGFALDLTDQAGWPISLRWSGPPSPGDILTPPANADRQSFLFAPHDEARGGPNAPATPQRDWREMVKSS